MKILFTLLLLTLLPFSAMAEGDDPVLIDGICYNLINKGLLAEVTANPNRYSGDVVIPSSVSYEGSEYMVTSIGSEAFSRCSDMTSLTIPVSVTKIGGGAFGGNKNLSALHISDLKVWCSIPFDNPTANPLAEAHHLYLNGEEITELVIPQGITSISEYAFTGCSALTSLQIPESVTKIGVGAFEACSSLVSLTLPGSLDIISAFLFKSCKSLTSVVLPEGVKNIGLYAFQDCSSLVSVTLPSSITGVDQFSFEGCKELKDVYCHAKEVPFIADNALKDSYPEYITLHVPEESIDAYKATEVWKDFKEIIDLDSKSSDASTGMSSDAVNLNGLFYKLIGKGLVAEVISDPEGSKYSGDVVIPSSVSYEGSEYTVTSIGSEAFSRCSDMTSLTIPVSVTKIGGGAFGGNKNLSALHISDLKVWCSIPFDNPTANPLAEAHHLYLNGEEITELVIPQGITSISEYAFTGCSALTSLQIPESVTKIGVGAFEACSSLVSLTLPGSLDIISAFLFKSCKSLTSVVLPEGVKNIGLYAFQDCSSLVSVTLPSSITGVDQFSFEGCKELKDVYCHAKEVPFIADNTLKDSYPEYITLHVPEKSVEAYKGHKVWGSFKEIVGFHVDEPSEIVEIVTSDGVVIKTEITIEIINENTKEAKITVAGIPASEAGSTEIAIPSNVGGYTITAIEANAFAGMTGITDIYFPDTDQPISLGTNALKIDDEHVATVHVPVGLLGSYALNEQLEQNFKDGKVKATVTAPNRYWTFSAGVDVVVPDGVGVYICKFENESQVKITQLGDDQLLVGSKRIIKANNGVLIACVGGTGGDAYDIVANPGGQWSMAQASYDAKSYGDDNMLEPVIVSKNYPATSYYVLKNGEFHKILANSSKMPAGKAVLRLPGVSNVRILSIIGGDDDTTGIHNRQIIEAESKWFDLQGRRIERPMKAGLYINNGKKVVIK